MFTNLKQLGRRLAVAVAIGLFMSLEFVASDVCAAPVDFLFTGTGSGSLDGVDFTACEFSVMISGDTDDIDMDVFGPDTPMIGGLNGTIDIDGFGVRTFFAPLYVFSYRPGECVGFGNSEQGDLIDVEEQGVDIDAYDLTTSFGPIFTATPWFYQFNSVRIDTVLLTFTGMWDVTFTAIVRGITVTIDVKPGSYPNSVNLGSNGVVPLAILSSPDFDATTVDESTVELAGALVAIRGKNRYLASHEDVNGDGLLDLVCHVDTANLDPGTFQEGFARVSGQTFDGSFIEGWDEITIVPQD